MVMCFTLIAFGQNQIYVNQVTTAGSMTFVQVGSLNKIGTSAGAPSDITGDSIIFENRQIGNNNNTLFSITGANNLKFLSAYTGDNNDQRYYFDGATNNMNFSFTGNSNKFLFNKDTTVDHTSDTDTSKATLSFSDLKFNVTGNSNILKFAVDGGKYNYLDYTIIGNSNTIKSTQIGMVGGAIAAKDGHEQTVSITGSSNDVTIYQAGLEKQTFNYTLLGSTNTVRIVQTTLGYAPLMTLNQNGSNGPAGTASTTATISPPSL
jgi:hypothetical protein